MADSANLGGYSAVGRLRWPRLASTSYARATSTCLQNASRYSDTDNDGEAAIYRRTERRLGSVGVRFTFFSFCFYCCCL
jgi:hypothetical protein